jgi:hypothetical protein
MNSFKKINLNRNLVQLPTNDHSYLQIVNNYLNISLDILWILNSFSPPVNKE